MNILLGCCASQASVPAATYKLNDNGANAAAFGVSLLPTISPARNRAVYTLTGSAGALLASPASIVAAPGLVTLVEGVPLVCGFKINSVPSAGILNEFYGQMFNWGGSGLVLAQISCKKDDGATTGEIKGEADSGGSATGFGSSYFGEMNGAKIALQLTITSGVLVAKAFVNGTLIGTSPGYATDGGVFGDMLVTDNATAGGVVDFEIVPTVAAGLDATYGTFTAGAVDMTGTEI